MNAITRSVLMGVVGAVVAAACSSEDDVDPSTSSPASSTSVASSTSGTGGSGGTAVECPHTGPDVIDPTSLEPCPTTVCGGGAHCVPSSLIPADFLSFLGDCAPDNKCVPDEFIKTNGNFIPPTCTSIAGAEGRCLSECLPQLAAQGDFLPVDVCAEFQRCAPCYDPVTGEETGACTLSCDPGPVGQPVTLPDCCGGLGTCVPGSLVPPAQVPFLPQDSCPQDANMFLCAPDVFVIDPNYVPETCETEIPIVGGEPGVCLPQCLLDGIQGQVLGQSSCDDNWKCIPCEDPFSGDPTGACDL
jgi:hypothetical protein